MTAECIKRKRPTPRDATLVDMGLQIQQLWKAVGDLRSRVHHLESLQTLKCLNPYQPLKGPENRKDLGYWSSSDEEPVPDQYSLKQVLRDLGKARPGTQREQELMDEAKYFQFNKDLLIQGAMDAVVLPNVSVNPHPKDVESFPRGTGSSGA